MGAYQTVQFPSSTMFPEQFLQLLKKRFGLRIKEEDTRPTYLILRINSEKYHLENSLAFIHFGYNQGRDFSIAFDSRNDGSKQLLLDIVRVTGGLYTDDLTQTFKEEIGLLNHEDGVPYLWKDGVISGLIQEKEDLVGLVKSILEFDKRCSNFEGPLNSLSHEKKSLKELKDFMAQLEL